VEEKKQAYKQSVPFMSMGQHVNKKRKLSHDPDADNDQGGYGSLFRDLPLGVYSHKSPSDNQIESNVSRFYVRKQIIVGNTSQYIGDKEEEDSAEPKNPTHKW
jgi:hypothetical protein